MQLGRTVDELKEGLTESALYQWVEFTKLWPWGEDARDVRAAGISQTVATFCQQTTRPKKYEHKKFLPFKRWDPTRRLTRDKVMAMLHGFFGTRQDGG